MSDTKKAKASKKPKARDEYIDDFMPTAEYPSGSMSPEKLAEWGQEEHKLEDVVLPPDVAATINATPPSTLTAESMVDNFVVKVLARNLTDKKYPEVACKGSSSRKANINEKNEDVSGVTEEEWLAIFKGLAKYADIVSAQETSELFELTKESIAALKKKEKIRKRKTTTDGSKNVESGSGKRGRQKQKSKKDPTEEAPVKKDEKESTEKMDTEEGAVEFEQLFKLASLIISNDKGIRGEEEKREKKEFLAKKINRLLKIGLDVGIVRTWKSCLIGFAMGFWLAKIYNHKGIPDSELPRELCLSKRHFLDYYGEKYGTTEVRIN